MLSRYRWQVATGATTVAAVALVSAAMLGHRLPAQSDVATPRGNGDGVSAIAPATSTPPSPAVTNIAEPVAALQPSPSEYAPSAQYAPRPAPSRAGTIGTGSGGNQPPPAKCTADDVEARLIASGTRSGAHNAAVEFTAKTTRGCLLPGVPELALSGGRDVRVSEQAAPTSPAVLLAPGTPAHIPLRWSTFEPAEQQQTPNTLTFTAPSEVTTQGVYTNPNMLLDWTLGPVDANPQHAGGVEIGALTSGSVPQY